IGLIFVVAIAPAVPAREEPDAGPGTRGSADPIELSGRHIQYWAGNGDRWAVLSGEAAVLQGTEGLRCRAAVVRIVEMGPDDARAYQVQVYAEGDVRLTSRAQPAGRAHRAVLTTRKGVKLSAYRDDGAEHLEEPPRGLKILDRSGMMPAAEAVPQPSRKGVALRPGATSPALPDLEQVPQ